MSRINELKQEQNDGHWNLVRFRSDVYDAYQTLEQTAFTDGALPGVSKELIAIGISVQSGCEAAIQKHIERAAGLGASFKEAVEAIEVGIVMGGGNAIAATHFAFLALDQVYARDILPK